MANTTNELRINLQQIAHHHPFLGAVGLGLNIVETEHFATAASDIKTLFVSATLLTTPPFDDPAVRRFFLAHNIFHHAFNHPFRTPGPPDKVNMEMWTVAQDIVVNNLLLAIQAARVTNSRTITERDKEIKFPLFRAPKRDGKLDISYDPKFIGWSAERIYIELVKDISKTGKPNVASISMPAPASTGAPTALEFKHTPVEKNAKWDTALGTHTYFKPDDPIAEETMLRQHHSTISAINQVKSCGSGIGDALRGLTEELANEPELEVALNEILTEVEIGDPSWARPKRRWLQDDLYFPAEDTTKGAHIVFGVDVSGSIGQKELHEFWSIIKGALESGLRLTADILSCDSVITSHHKVSWSEPESYEKIKDLPGGGGTDFRPIFRWAEKNAPDAKAIVIFTDLCGSFPEACETPTFWLVDTALKSHMKPPFGQTIFYKPTDLYTKN